MKVSLPKWRRRYRRWLNGQAELSTPIPSRHNPFCHPRASGDPYLYFTWIPAPRFHEDKLRGNDRYAFDAVCCQGIGVELSTCSYPMILRAAERSNGLHALFEMANNVENAGCPAAVQHFFYELAAVNEDFFARKPSDSRFFLSM